MPDSRMFTNGKVSDMEADNNSQLRGHSQMTSAERGREGGT